MGMGYSERLIVCTADWVTAETTFATLATPAWQPFPLSSPSATLTNHLAGSNHSKVEAEAGAS